MLTEDEATGLLLPLEKVEPAQFDLRLGFRSSAGPFRSFARLAVEPRPYQLVPLMLALKLDPVRILRDKFHIEAEVVLPSAATRLERDCGRGTAGG